MLPLFFSIENYKHHTSTLNSDLYNFTEQVAAETIDGSLKLQVDIDSDCEAKQTKTSPAEQLANEFS